MFPAGPEQRAQDQSDPRPQLEALGRSLPDPNSELRIRVIPAGPQLQALDGSLPDPNSKHRIRVLPAGLQLQALDRSVPRRTRTASSGAE